MDSYKEVIKKVPTQHLIDWLARHDDLEGTDHHTDYRNELEVRRADKNG